MVWIDDADAFVAVPKVMLGDSEWQAEPGGLEQRWRRILLVRGEPLGRLEVIAYPVTPSRGFTVMVLFGDVPLMRLTVDEGVHRHVNVAPPPGFFPGVSGPRLYLWEHNRQRLGPGRRENLLAIQADRRICSLENGIRHLCGLANVDLTTATLPAYPPRTLLG